MCGIVYVIKKDKKHSAVKSTIKKYEDQKTRGKQGFGFLAVDNGDITKWGQSEHEEGIIDILHTVKTPEILFHHRYPTSTPNVLEGTHPIKVSNEKLKYDYYVVHNGVISNADTLKTKYEKEGYVYNTVCKTVTKKYYETDTRIYNFADEVDEEFNDSESFAIDIAKAIDGGKSTIDSLGSIAFIAFQVDKVTKKKVNTFFGRNARNPLILMDNKDIFTLSSQGTGKEVKEHTLYSVNAETCEVEEVRHLSIGSEYTTPSTPLWKPKELGSGKVTDINYDDWEDDNNDFFRGYGKKHTVRYEDTIDDDIVENVRDFDREYNAYCDFDIDTEENDDGTLSVYIDGSEDFVFLNVDKFKEYYENLSKEFDALTIKVHKNKDDKEAQALLDNCAYEVEVLSAGYYQITVAFQEMEDKKKGDLKSPYVAG